MAETILVIGSANADYVIHTAKMPMPGETVAGSDFAVNVGGKGLNQAVAIAKLGGEVTFCGVVGKDANGAMLLEELQTHGVTFCGAIAEDAPTGVAMITVANGENCIVLHEGANARLTPTMAERCEKEIADAAYCVMQLEIPLETVERVCEIAAQTDTKIVLNPAPFRSLPPSLLSQTAYLIPNEHEARELVGFPLADEASCKRAVERLLAMGVSDDQSQTERARKLYHNLCSWGSGGAISAYNQTLIDVMVTGEGLCASFAQSYNYMLQRCGIQARYISVRAAGERHALSYMNLDGQWFASDPTFQTRFRFDINDMLLFDYSELITTVDGFDEERYNAVVNNPVTLTGTFDVEVMAPYLAQAYRDNTSVYFVCEEFEQNPFEYYYFVDTFVKENKAALLEAVNRYLEEDEQLTEWIFRAGMIEWGTVTVGVCQGIYERS